MCSHFWKSVDCNGLNDTKYTNGTCYRILNDGHNQTNRFLGLYDAKIAAEFKIEPVLPAQEYFQ